MTEPVPSRQHCQLLARAIGMALAGCVVASAAHAQTPLERTALLDGASAGLPWSLDVQPAFRFAGGAPGAELQATFDLALGLPRWLLAGARYTAQSPVVAGRPDEWELYGRWAPLAETAGAPVSAAVQLGFNGAATSPDAELTLSRWFSPVRVLGAARVLGDAFGTGSTRGALGAGVVLFPSPSGLPVSLAADGVTLLDRDGEAGERVAWSVAANVGVAYSTHTLSVIATNTASGTLHGTARGDRRTRYGFRFTAPLPIGRLFGLVVPRARARAAVTTAAPAPAAIATTIFRHAFVDYRIVVPRGTTIEWTNRDDVVHTVTADDGSWNSGAIQPGERWRARFDEPGIYPYHCGPHPYMKGVVVVR